MRKISNTARVATALPALLLASQTAFAANQPIAEFEAARQTAWNAHDGAAYAAAFDASADIITSLGWHWTGQAQAAQNFSDGFKFVYAQAHLQVSDVHTRELTPELTYVTQNWSIVGARTMDSGLQAGEQHGFETQLLQRHGESWVVLAQQDTIATASPPAPSPVSSPTTSPSAEQAPPPASTFPTAPPPVRRCVLARANGKCIIYGKAKPAS